eukprot:COSAG06_NODE_8003_length_2306_cov_1.574082_2_plen_91_part_00
MSPTERSGEAIAPVGSPAMATIEPAAAVGSAAAAAPAIAPAAALPDLAGSSKSGRTGTKRSLASTLREVTPGAPDLAPCRPATCLMRSFL